MKLENQVTNLELSKKLKELGVKQESLFYWVKSEKAREKCPDCKKAGGLIPECFYCGGTGKGEMMQNYRLYPITECINNSRSLDYSAYTVAELGELLPDTEGFKNRYKQYIMSFRKKDDVIETFIDKNEANTRAKMLIYLLENNLITL